MTAKLDWLRVDLSKYLNEHTQMLATLLIDEYGDVHGREILGVIVQHLGGMRLDLNSPDRIALSLTKAFAEKLICDGESDYEIRSQTHLSYHMIRQLRMAVAAYDPSGRAPGTGPASR